MPTRPTVLALAVLVGAVVEPRVTRGPAWAHAEAGALWTVLPSRPRRLSTPLADLAEKARPAVVHVRGVAPPEDDSSSGHSDGAGERVSIGTGFVINKK